MRSRINAEEPGSFILTSAFPVDRTGTTAASQTIEQSAQARPARPARRQGPTFIEVARRAQIVRATIDTVAEVGVDKASFTRVAARAGISAGLISYHFAGRDELLAAVRSELTAVAGAALSGGTDQPQPYADTLAGLIRGYVCHCARYRSELLALAELERSGGQPPAALVDRLGELLTAGQRAGEFRAFSPRLMAVSLAGALHAVPAELRARPDTDSGAYAEELATAATRAVLRTKTAARQVKASGKRR